MQAKKVRYLDNFKNVVQRPDLENKQFFYRYKYIASLKTEAPKIFNDNMKASLKIKQGPTYISRLGSIYENFW